jgi:iron(III) transport system ATP-binding protein
MAEVNPLSVQGLSHRYGDTPILNNIDLHVNSGEFVALLGPSGCGKTTLLKAIAGLVRPNEGRIEIDGTSVLEDGVELIACERRGIGLVFQEYALFPHMTVRQNVGYGVASNNQARINGLIELVGLSALSERLPSELSGGQQQRVALARALAPRPALLLLDEPFANVDAALRESLGRLLRRVVRDQGAAVLMVTHDQRSALALADRVIVMEANRDGGAVVQNANPITIYHQPANPDAARLTGPCSFFRATADGKTAESPLGTLNLSSHQSGPVNVMVRPEQLRFNPNHDGNAVVEDIIFSGSTHTLLCSTLIGSIEVMMPSTEPPPARGSQGAVQIEGPVWAFPMD